MHSDRRNILFVFTRNFVRERRGNYNRAIQILELLTKLGLRVTVYSKNRRGKAGWFKRKKGEPAWSTLDIEAFSHQFPNFDLVLDEVTPLAEIMRSCRVHLCTMWPSIAPRILRMRLPGADPNWRALAEHGADLVIVEYTQSLATLNGLFGDYCVVDQNDVEFVLHQRSRGRRFYELSILTRARREFGMLEAVDMVLCISPAEHTLVRMLVRRPEPVYLPYLDPRILADRIETAVEAKYDLLFVGAQGQFNAEGICTLLHAVKVRGSDFRIAIVGTVCNDRKVQEAAQCHDSIELLGYVENLSELYRASRAAICPVGGAGTKLKIIEALQNLRPVFASQESLEGLMPGYEKCVFSIDLSTIEQILASSGDFSGECKKYLSMYEMAIQNNRFVARLNSMLQPP